MRNESALKAIMEEAMLVNFQSAERKLRSRLKPGDILLYPVERCKSFDGRPIRCRTYIRCIVQEIYPHLVKVVSYQWLDKPFRTISYADMIVDRKILSTL